MHITYYVYIKSTTVDVPSSELGLSQPLSRQRLCFLCPLLPEPGGGGAHSLAGEGLGDSQFRRLEKSLALCQLCDRGTRNAYGNQWWRCAIYCKDIGHGIETWYRDFPPYSEFDRFSNMTSNSWSCARICMASNSTEFTLYRGVGTPISFGSESIFASKMIPMLTTAGESMMISLSI